MFSSQVHYFWKLQLSAPTEGVTFTMVLGGVGASSARGGPTLGSLGPPTWQCASLTLAPGALLPLDLHSGGTSILTAGQKISG